MPASDSMPEHQHQLTRRRLLATGAGAAAAFGLPRFAPAASAASVNAGARGYAAAGAAVASVDLSGSWSFTPVGQGTTSIMVPGGGWAVRRRGVSRRRPRLRRSAGAELA